MSVGDNLGSQAKAGSTLVFAPDGAAGNNDHDEEDEILDLESLQGFASKVQRQPEEEGSVSNAAASRLKIAIPKRGEKDFEPMAETVNLQEMMLQRSRQAMFGALTGVRGGNSKTMSHALLPPSNSYPRILITRGHLLDTMGMSIKQDPVLDLKRKTYVELLPEEALYLLERGSLQIWLGPPAVTLEDVERGLGEWDEESQGVKGAVEMSVMEGFATFIGQDDLTWERYQAYSYLKRLGYTVQRTRQFIPTRFLDSQRLTTVGAKTGAPFRTWWLSLPRWLGISGSLTMSWATHLVGSTLRVLFPFSDGLRPAGKTYEILLATLRRVGRTRRSNSEKENALQSNPYLPFWHVWKPATPWSKGNWDRGASDAKQTRADFNVAVINARDVSLPTHLQLTEIFDCLPDEPKGPVKKLGPQYAQRDTKSAGPSTTQTTWWTKIMPSFSTDGPAPFHSNMGTLRNGDRALVVAVNDSGNTGWVRFGRTGFYDCPVL